MRLECAYGEIGRIAAVDVQLDDLVSVDPILLDDALVIDAGFVVKHPELDHMVKRLETAHDLVVGLDAVFFLLGLEGGVKYGVGFAMIGDRDVLVSAAGAEGGAATVVIVKFFLWV